MKDAINIVREIQSANPTGLRSLFMRYGIGAQTTPRNVILATMAFGEAFTTDLYSLYAETQPHNFDGSTDYLSDYLGTSNNTMESGLLNYDNSLIFGSGATPQTYDLTGAVVSTPAPATKSNGLANFTSIFNSVAGLIGTGVNTAVGVSSAIKTGQTQQTPAQMQANSQLLLAQASQAQSASDSKTKQMLVIGAVLVVVVLVGFLIFRKK